MCSKKIQIIQKHTHQSEVHFLREEGAADFSQLLENISGQPFVVIDEAVAKLYPQVLQAIKAPLLRVPGGETHKTMSMVEKIINFLQTNQCGRHDSLIVIGGGCIGDVAGFAASIYKRGISWFFWPTTLISQIDSSIGGKVAINTSYGKNQLGAFWPAQGVYITDNFLKTLDCRQYNAGLAEAIKVALLVGGKLLDLLENENISKSSELTALCINAKLKVINDDWREQADGTRIGLNFGHTIGHGLEKVAPTLLHGEAVSIGMVTELYLAKGMGEDTVCPQRLSSLLSRFDLPTRFHHYAKGDAWPLFVNALLQDKKNGPKDICFVVPTVGGNIKKLHLSPAQLKINLF